jgi:NADH-quinone oxidoreductase subunit K
MPSEIALLNNYLIVGALLFGIGVVGFVSRRNMIVMFLSVEMMLQGVSISLVAWSRFHNNFDGQVFIIFMIAVAACEAAVALALILTLFYRSGKLDMVEWQFLRETGQPPYRDEPLAEEPQSEREPMPRLVPAGVQPEIPREEIDYRPNV